MLSTVLVYFGSIVLFLWGLAHLAATRSVVNGFGPLSEDNRRIITMEWIAEGLTMCFIGTVVMLASIIACSMNPLLPIVYRGSAIMLLILAAVSTATGARTPALPMKLCPAIKTAVAIMFLLGNLL